MTRVLVGMSGGVDSSVAAALLVEQGFDVTGAYMKNWTLDVPGMQCPWAEDLAYAKRTAVKLGIDFRVYDFQEEYKREVVDYLVAEYEAGRTPNPDIMCNQQVKFGSFLQAALADGFDYIATGHYANVAATKDLPSPDNVINAKNLSSSTPSSLPSPDDPTPTTVLLRAADEHKDQTYFLYRLSHDALAHTFFPLGTYTKQQVRAMAEQRGLPAAHKPDSQGICFIGEASIQDFLRQYVQSSPGKIIDAETGEKLGAHEGALFYTLGQRKGLKVGGGIPYVVVGKSMETNTVYVAHANTEAAQQNLQATELDLQDCSWIAGMPPKPGDYLVRTRHTGDFASATFTPTSSTSAHIQFADPHERVAPGQSAVIYQDRMCLGGGIAC